MEINGFTNGKDVVQELTYAPVLDMRIDMLTEKQRHWPLSKYLERQQCMPAVDAALGNCDCHDCDGEMCSICHEDMDS